MSFQVQNSPLRSTFQGLPVRGTPLCARQLSRPPVRVQALGALESMPVIVEAMKIGFTYAAIPGVLKGAWDVKQAMAEPNPPKPLTDARKSVMVSNEAARYGSAGALMGLSTGMLATQCNMAPDSAWQAGTVTGLCLYALLVGIGKQVHAAHKAKVENEASRPAESSVDAREEGVDQPPEQEAE